MPRKKKIGNTMGQRVMLHREALGWTLDRLADETGYAVEVLQAVEEDRIVPPVSLVLQLSRVLKLGDEEWDQEDTKSTRRRKRSHQKRVDSYAYAALTRPADDKHLRAYLVTIEAQMEHHGVEYHHEGEEFIYVLKGTVQVQVGEVLSVLSRGQSLHFNSALHHKLSNSAEEAVKLLVVIYIP